MPLSMSRWTATGTPWRRASVEPPATQLASGRAVPQPGGVAVRVLDGCDHRGPLHHPFGQALGGPAEGDPPGRADQVRVAAPVRFVSGRIHHLGRGELVDPVRDGHGVGDDGSGRDRQGQRMVADCPGQGVRSLPSGASDSGPEPWPRKWTSLAQIRLGFFGGEQLGSDHAAVAADPVVLAQCGEEHSPVPVPPGGINPASINDSASALSRTISHRHVLVASSSSSARAFRSAGTWFPAGTWRHRGDAPDPWRRRTPG